MFETRRRYVLTDGHEVQPHAAWMNSEELATENRRADEATGGTWRWRLAENDDCATISDWKRKYLP